MDEWTIGTWLTLTGSMTFGILWLLDCMKWKRRTYPPWFYIKSVFCLCFCMLPMGMAYHARYNVLMLLGITLGIVVFFQSIYRMCIAYSRNYHQWRKSNPLR